MKIGDMIEVKECCPGVHPVGIILRTVKATKSRAAYMMCLYLDGDYEALEYDTPVEVLYDGR